MSSTVLTESQKTHFQLFGYIVLRQLLSQGEIDQLSVEVSSALEAEYGGGWREERTSRNVNGATQVTPLLASLLEDSRFLDVAELLLQRPLVLWGAEANSYRGDTLEHVDLPDAILEVPAIKFVAYLDRVGAGSGALKFVPGSHRLPLREDLFAYSPAHEGTKFVGATQEMDAPFIACETEPGDVVVFHESIWHATKGGGTDRRMVTVIYHTVPDELPERQALGRYLKYALGRLREAGWSERATTARGRQLIRRMEELVEAAAADE